MTDAAAPAVSVLLPVRNGDRYIAESIDSILAQTLTALELVVVDNGSTDATPSILAAIHDPRVRVVPEPRPGLVRALNTGLAACRAPLVARQDADDVSLPHRLERQADFMADHPDVVLVSATGAVIDADGRATGRLTRGRRAPVREIESGFNPVIHTSVMFRRDAVDRVGGYDPAFELAQDYDLWLRLRRHGRLVTLPDVLVRLRKHGENRSRDERCGVNILASLLRDRVAERTGRTDDRADQRTLDAARRVAGEFHQETWRQRRQGILEAGELLAARQWAGLRPRHLRLALARLGGRGAILPWELARLTRRALAQASAAPDEAAPDEVAPDGIAPGEAAPDARAGRESASREAGS